jgi:hypothetical protein
MVLHAELSAADVPSFTLAPIVQDFLATFMKLDDISEPGVPEHVFWQLVTKCRTCRHYMTKRITSFHDCKGAGPSIGDVIDLTNED